MVAAGLVEARLHLLQSQDIMLLLNNMAAKMGHTAVAEISAAVIRNTAISAAIISAAIRNTAISAAIISAAVIRNTAISAA